MSEGLDPIAGYNQSDLDTSSASPQYFGFINSSTAWYISQTITSGNITSYRYIAGSGLMSYQSNWSNRTSLVYDYYSNVFQNT